MLLHLIHWELQVLGSLQGRPIAGDLLAQEYRSPAFFFFCLKVRHTMRCSGHSKSSLVVMPKIGPRLPSLYCLASSPPHCPLPPSPFLVSPGSTFLINHLHTNTCLRVCFSRTQPKTTSIGLWAILYQVQMIANQVLKELTNHCIRKGWGRTKTPCVPSPAKQYGKSWLDFIGSEHSTSKISEWLHLRVIGASSSQREGKLKGRVVCWWLHHHLEPTSFNSRARVHLKVSLKQEISENLGGRNLSCLCTLTVFRTYKQQHD